MSEKKYVAYVGTYTNGSSLGIHVYDVDVEAGRLSERGVVKNENTVVTSLISKDQAQQAEIDQLVEKTFEGSLPAFIAAFARSQKLSKEDVEELERLIEKGAK